MCCSCLVYAQLHGTLLYLVLAVNFVELHALTQAAHFFFFTLFESSDITLEHTPISQAVSLVGVHTRVHPLDKSTFPTPTGKNPV